MISLYNDLNRWAQHTYGDRKIKMHQNAQRLTEAVGLNKNAESIISTFGKKEFDGAVGFLDIVGFSQFSKNRSPSEISALVKPFIRIVIDVAREHHCFVDKTIGDEVMVILPWFPSDVSSNNENLNLQNKEVNLLLSVCTFLASLFDQIKLSDLDYKFTNGFSIGSLYLDKVGTNEYSEWTCYGNCINAAKRLQGVASKNRNKKYESNLIFALGALDFEFPEFDQELNAILEMWKSEGLIKFENPIIDKQDLKGVGNATYLLSGLNKYP